MTSIDLGLMLGDLNADWGNVKHLPPLDLTQVNGLQVCRTVRTLRSRMDLNVIWLRDHLQGAALVARLPATAAACFLAQTPCPGLLQPVTAGWLATVAAMLGQLIP